MIFDDDIDAGKQEEKDGQSPQPCECCHKEVSSGNDLEPCGWCDKWVCNASCIDHEFMKEYELAEDYICVKCSKKKKKKEEKKRKDKENDEKQ